MKRLISTLTALCMCASLSVGVLPASALTAIPSDGAVIARADSDIAVHADEKTHDGFEWYIGDVVYDPAVGGRILLPISVWGDPGTTAVECIISIDGQTVDKADCPFKVLTIKNEKAYQRFETWTPNPEVGKIGAAQSSGKVANETAENGNTVMTYYLEVKEGATLKGAGEKYVVDFDFLKVGDETEKEIVPKKTAGSITIAGEGNTDPDPTDPDPTDPDPTEPDPTQTAEGFKWYIEDTTYDPAVGGQFDLLFKVTGDPGTAAFKFGITIDGKKVTDEDCPFKVLVIKNSKEAYQKLSAWMANPEKGIISAAQSETKVENEVAANDSATVCYVLEAKEGATLKGPGEKYEVKFDNLLVSDENESHLTPDTSSGYIVIAGEGLGDSTEPSTPPATDPPFENQQKQVDAEWIIGNDTVEPGATVTIPVSVKGNTDGFNSYIAKIKTEQPVLKDSANGAVSGNLNFVGNAQEMTFSATNFTIDGENVTGDGDVFYMTFTAPTEPGKYDITFDNLEIYDIGMVQLIPKTTNGWIEVKAADTEFNHEKKDTNATWIIGKEEVEAGATVQIPVSVQGASDIADGINSYVVKIKQDAGPTATNATSGTAYSELGLTQNLAELIFAGTNPDKNENIATADGDVFYIEFKVPDDAAPGTIYNLSFADIELENMDMVQLIPKTEDGWIKVKEAETTTTTEPPVVSDAGMWIIGTDTVAPGATVTIPVTVTGDKNGINSFKMAMGKDNAVTANTSEKGSAYEALGFVFNLDEMTFAGTNHELSQNIIAEDNSVVFYVTFTAPTEPGKYDLTFDSLEVFDMNMSGLTPDKQNGWIEVVADTTTTPPDTTTTPPDTTTTPPDTTTAPPDTTTTPPDTTTAPPDTTTTPPDTTTAPPDTTTTTEPIVIGDAGMWIIGTDTVAPGATVTIPVTVTGDKNGINSFKMAMGKDNAVTANTSEKGSAYEALGFVFNLDEMTFAGTNHELSQNIIPEDNSVVFYVTFTAPTEPGKYDLTFEDLEVFDINMSELTPEKQNGWIEVIADTTTTPPDTTTAPPDTTTAPPDTTTAPPDTTTAPPDTTTAPPDTTTAPPDTTTTPPETTTTGGEIITPPDTETTTDGQKPGTEYTVTWTIGKVVAHAGQSNVKVPITVSAPFDEALTYNLFEFNLKVDDGPVFNKDGLAAGEAYSEFTIIANDLTIAGNNSTGDSVGYNNATLLYLSFDIPEGVTPGVYSIEFNGDAEAHNRHYDIFDIEEENGSITVLDDGVNVDTQEYQYDIEGKSKFYFSHDHRKFIDDDLLKTDLISVGTLRCRPVLSNGEYGEWTVADLDNIEFKIKDETWESPKAVFDNVVAPTLTNEKGIAFFKEQIPFTITTTFERYNTETKEIEEVEITDLDELYDGSPIVTGEAYIGVKGDTNLDGIADAEDATLMLIYSANEGANLKPSIRTVESDMINALSEEELEVLEDFVFFLSDVDDESEDHGETNSLNTDISYVDADDATFVLIYAAEQGAGNNPDWYRLLKEPLPKYTKAIGAADGNNDRT